MIPNEIREMVKSSGSRLPLATWETRQFDIWEWTGTPRGDGLIPEESLEAWRRQGFHHWSNERGIPFLFIYGPAGVGKTHLALALAWQKFGAWNGKTRILFYQVEGLMDSIRAGFDSGESNELLEGVKNCDLLVLDDIGAQKLTPWVVAKLDSIIDYRYIEGKETIFTSNYSLADKERIPERIADRIREGTLVRLRGKSRRGLK